MTTVELPSPTARDIWRLFEETSEQFKSVALSFQETNRRFQETDQKFQETDRKFQETDRKFLETTLKFQETDRLLKARSDETDRKFQETDRLLKEVSRKIGQLGNRLGDFVEEMVKPALVRLFQARGLSVHRTMQNLVCRDDLGQYRAQVDLVVIDGDTAIAVECKSQLSVDDVDEHLARLELFKSCWPEYGGYRLLGGIAAMVVPEDVGRYAYRKGLYVLAQSGDALEIRNDDRFQPRVW